MISIITVCYNAEEEIEKTIKSVLGQTYKPFEYIFVDGKSNDGTMAIIEKYVPEFEKIGIVVKLISEPDAGIYDAMNKGIKISGGEWINFMNAGDCFHDQNVLEQIHGYMEEDEDIVVGEFVYIEKYLGKRISHVNLELLKKRMIFCHQAVFTARRLFEEKLYDLQYRYCADYDWLLSMYLQGKRYQCVDVLVADFDTTGTAYQNREKTNIENKKIKENYNIISLAENKSIKDILMIIKESLYKIAAHNKMLAKVYYKIWSKKKERYIFL